MPDCKKNSFRTVKNMQNIKFITCAFCKRTPSQIIADPESDGQCVRLAEEAKAGYNDRLERGDLKRGETANV